MKWSGGRAERKMGNKKFRRIEEAILIAYFRLKNFPNAGVIAKWARISRSTLYRHHTTVYGIPQDYTKYLIIQYKRSMRKILSKENVSVRTVIYCMLTFMTINRKNLIKLLELGNNVALNEMIDFLKIRVVEEWENEKNPEVIFDIYKGEVLGVIEKWGKAGFSEKRMKKVLGVVLYFTETIGQWLGPVLK